MSTSLDFSPEDHMILLEIYTRVQAIAEAMQAARPDDSHGPEGTHTTVRR